MQRMKKYIYCALMALLCLACSKEDDPSMDDTPIVIPKTLYAQAPVFESRAAFEDQPVSWDDAETVDSRTYAVIDEGGATYTQYWSPGDAISVFCTTANLPYQMNSYKDGVLDIGKFNLAGSASQGTAISTNYYYSVYPYKADTKISNRGYIDYTFPSEQHYSEDSYANGENGMVAIISKSEWKDGADESNVLYFKNFCSYLQLRMISPKGESKTVSKITLTANNSSERITGLANIRITDENSAPRVTMTGKANTNEITLDCGNGVELSQDENNPTKFWFVLPAGVTFKNVFTVFILFKDNSYFDQNTMKTISIDRNHIKPMATFTTSTDQTTTAIRYKLKDSNNGEPYPLKKSFLGENGSVLNVIRQEFDETTGEWIVHLSGTLKAVGGNAFTDQAPALEYIKIDNGEEPITVSDFAFYNCTAERIEINNDVVSIGNSTFTGSKTTEFIINGDVATIKKDAGTGSELENIQISGSVGTIEEQAFAGCTNLQTFDVGSIESIGYRAFYLCSNLSTVNIPGLKTLGIGAFRSCTSLTEIDLMSIVSIDDNAFMDCSGLTTADIGENCIMIGEGAFCRASSLHTVYCHAVEPPFIKTDNYDGSYVFDSVDPQFVIYIPSGSYYDYVDLYYFEDHPWEDDSIIGEDNAIFNWWWYDYEDKLVEYDFSTTN